MRCFPNNNPKREREVWVSNITSPQDLLKRRVLKSHKPKWRVGDFHQGRNGVPILLFPTERTKRNRRKRGCTETSILQNPDLVVHVFKFQESKNWCQWITKGWMGIILVFRASHVNPDSDIHCPPKTWQYAGPKNLRNLWATTLE